jgi:hypothetical protein
MSHGARAGDATAAAAATARVRARRIELIEIVGARLGDTEQQQQSPSTAAPTH